jgi:hypothetical protein
MTEHPWTELQVLIREKWLTQKEFSSVLWKKVSELNELLKWKRNITIQRDYLLHKSLWTPIKYRILKQIDYDYSLLNVEDFNDISPVETEKDIKWVSDYQDVETKESNSESTKLDEDIKERANIFRSF